MAFKPIVVGQGGEKFKFEKVGDQLTGFYLGTDEIEINGKVTPRHSFKTDKGVVSTLSSYALDEGISKMKVGALARITYTEKKRLGGGKTLKVFSFEMDEEAVDTGAAPQPANVAATLRGRTIA